LGSKLMEEDIWQAQVKNHYHQDSG
jgi:hypothetical protein